MKLGIMQPYFLPYIGYFSLIHYSDRFIFFDTPQYMHHSWVNRNRILNSNKVPSYIMVPLQKMPQETAIRDMRIRDEPWKEKILSQLVSYKKRAPFYKQTMEFLEEMLNRNWDGSLSQLNIETTKIIANHIGIKTEYDVFSEMNLEIGEVNAADEWALNITKAVGADIYVNPPGGMSFFDKKKYVDAGIDLQFLRNNLKPYVQRIGYFEKGLSIIDVMMFNDKSAILQLLEDYDILRL